MKTLLQSQLFKGLNDAQAEEKLEHKIRIATYQKGEFVAQKGQRCDFIGIVKSGKLVLEHYSPAGNIVSLIQLEKANFFGEALIFGQERKFPVNIQALEDSQLYIINKENLIDIFQVYPVVLENYLSLMSRRLFTLNKKIQYLSLETIEKKLIFLLLSEYKKSNSLEFTITLSREQMANLMAVQRPSLSRVLKQLKDKNLIDYHKNNFKILNVEALEAILR